MFKVNLERRVGSVHSTITLEVTADNRDEAASLAESILTGWKTLQVSKA